MSTILAPLLAPKLSNPAVKLALCPKALGNAPSCIVVVPSWLAVAPAAAPDFTVATAVPSTDPVKFPLSVVAVYV